MLVLFIPVDLAHDWSVQDVDKLLVYYISLYQLGQFYLLIPKITLNNLVKFCIQGVIFFHLLFYGSLAC